MIIPCYNGASYLVEAMESIEQQEWPFEIVLIDDGSTDNSKQLIAQRYPQVRYFYKENSSPAAARNMGIALASHDILTFLDVDDRWQAYKTREQIALLHQDKTVDVVGGLVNYDIMPESLYRSTYYSGKPIEHILLSSVMVRCSVFDRIGTFDETLRHGEDLDWFLRLKESGLSYSILDTVVLNYRIHEKSMTARKSVKGLGTTDVIRKALERKRRLDNE